MLYYFTGEDYDGARAGLNKYNPLVRNGQEPFTLAKLSPDIISGDIIDAVLDSPDRQLSLEPLCKLEPEVVETGLRKDMVKAFPPIPLFLPSELQSQATAGKEMEEDGAIK